MDKLKSRRDFKGKKAEKFNFREYTELRKNDLGSTLIKKTDLFVINNNNRFVPVKYEFSSALLKIIDEIITNAEDVYVDFEGKKYQTKTIKITCDDEGTISVYNDGNGIPLYKHNDEMSSVELMFSCEYSSTNYNDEEDQYSVTGGLNGVGAKLTNIFSHEFIVETVCYESGQKYVQRFHDGMKNIDPPTITKTKEKPYTKITFKPRYHKLCTNDQNVDNPHWFPHNANTVKKIVERRAYEVMVYLNNLSHRFNGERMLQYMGKPKIYFNDFKLPNITLLDFAKMHYENCYELEFEGKQEFPLKVVIAVKEPVKENRKFKGVGFEHFSYINGIVTMKLSNYMNKLLKQVEHWLINRKKLNKVYGGKKDATEIPKQYFRDTISVFSTFVYPKKRYDLENQTKDRAMINKSDLLQFNNTYKITDKSLNSFYRRSGISGIVSQINGIKVSKKNIKLKMYDPATDIRKKNSDCTCFIVEGNSAAKLIRSIIGFNPELSFRKYGVYSVQGKPINVLKKMKYENGKCHSLSKQLQESENFLALLKVLGLDFNETYEDEHAIKKLTYQHIIFATDQDMDGIGHICTLLLTIFVAFWPNLIKHGYISRFRTPVIRVYHGSNVFEFYSGIDYNKWVNEKGFENVYGPGSKYDTRYYKGLSSHNEMEAKFMAKNFRKNVLLYRWDDDAIKAMIKMMGTDSKFRKKILSIADIPDYKHKNDTIDVSEQFMIDNKQYGLYNNIRKIPDVFDGFIPVQRKAFCASRTMLKSNKGRYKIAAVANYTSKEMDYQHGESSMEGTVSRMCQCFPGAYIIPPFSPRCDGLGGRDYGRDDFGESRYTYLGKNKITEHLFPLEDDYIYEYEFPEGSQCEPTAFAPILPRILFEHYYSMGTGWNFRSTARDFDLVVRITKKAIMEYPNIELPNMFGFPQLYPGMRCKVINGHEYMFGSYDIVDDNKIIITELPLFKWVCNVKDAATKSDLVESFTNLSVGDDIKIEIELKSGALDEINHKYRDNQHIDPIEEYFGLYEIAHCRLNFNHKGSVTEYDNYGQIFRSWFEYRRQMYIKRIEYKEIVLRAKIDMYENMLAFILKDAEKSFIDKLSDEKREKLLETTPFVYTNGDKKSGFMRLNSTYIEKRQYISSMKKLRNMIYDINNSYDYIYKITKRMTSKPNIEKMRKKIENLYAELETLLSNDWRFIWYGEIENLLKMIKDGRETNWTYDKTKYNFEFAEL